jgi:DNA-binding NarL/FixJ family response regulator
VEGRAHVAVLDPLPLFQRGVVEALTSDETLVEVPADVRAWAARGGRRVVILTLAAPADWELLGQLGRETLVIALLEENTGPSSIRALRLGAGSVVARNATSAVLRRALDAVLAGEVVLSRSVVQALLSSSRSAESTASPRILDDAEVLWLRQLASGVTVARLAASAGYSERAMYRLLNRIYDRLGVTNRTEALIKANAYGWLGTGS